MSKMVKVKLIENNSWQISQIKQIKLKVRHENLIEDNEG